MHSVMIKLNKQYKKSRTQKKGWFIILWTNYSLKNKYSNSENCNNMSN